MLFDLCTCTYSEWDDEGFLQLQRDPQGDGSASPVEACHTYGFLGRPCDPGDDKIGCNLLIGRVGSEHFAWAQHDPRSTDWLPRVTAGGSAQYGGTVGRALTWREIDGETGTVTDYVPVEWDASGLATKAHKVEVGVDGAGAPVVQMIHSSGASVVMLGTGIVISDATGTAYIQIDGGAVTLNGTTKLVGGLDVGGTGGLPVALQPPLAAALTAFAAAVAAAPVVPADGGAALKVAITAAAQALAAAAGGMAATMAKSL